YHQRYRRRVRDYLLASLEALLPWAQRMPAIYNAVVANPWVGRLTERSLGVSNLPVLSRPGVDAYARQLNVRTFLSGTAVSEKTVYLLQDPFNRYFEASVFQAAMRLLLALGYEPVLLPYHPSGKPQHVAGFLGRFHQTAKQQLAILKEAMSTGAPMIALEPSVGLCLRDEYQETLGLNGDEIQVAMIQEWLVGELPGIEKQAESGLSFKLMIHCTEKSELPSSGNDWQRIFQHLGADLSVEPSGCCGMAGVYGHQSEHAERSKAIYDLSWRKPVESSDIPVLATGYSCRSQVRKQSAVEIEHPVQALANMLSRTTTSCRRPSG
ncbi:MAG: (Fe-S)-binding protein, partial [Gammaproteobacteria bacterium]